MTETKYVGGWTRTFSHVIFEQTPERSQGRGLAEFWRGAGCGKGVSGRRNSQDKGPQAGVYLVFAEQTEKQES